MFCTNCGNPAPEGNKFCQQCGCPVAQQPAPRELSMKEYLRTEAPRPVRRSAKLLTVTFILTMVLVVSSALAPVYMSVFHIPVVDGFLSLFGADEEDTRQMLEQLDEYYQEVEAEFRREQQSLTALQQTAGEKILRCLGDLAKLPSVTNFQRLVEATESNARYNDQVGNLYMAEFFSYLTQYLITCLMYAFALPVVLTLFAGTGKSAGVTIAALAFTVISQLVFSGILWVLASLVLYITQAVLCSKVNKAYRIYREGAPA